MREKMLLLLFFDLINMQEIKKQLIAKEYGIANSFPKQPVVKQAGIIIKANELHWRNNVPFIKRKKKTKKHRESDKYQHKKQVGRYQ
jgi:hypothetical protein